MPLTRNSASMRVKRCMRVRSSSIARARVGPMPGKRSSSSLDALLMLTTPIAATFGGSAAGPSARSGLGFASQAHSSANEVQRDGASVLRLLEVMVFLRVVVAVVVAQCRAHADMPHSDLSGLRAPSWRKWRRRAGGRRTVSCERFPAVAA
jgi:hypothetical protein